MKKLHLLVFLFIGFNCIAQVNINNVLNTVNSTIGNSNLGKGLTNQDIINGLKEALTVGSKNAGDKASKTDGFYKNSLIKIPFPSEAANMKTTLVNLGMKRQVEDFEKQLNRAAEDAAIKAAPVFLNAIKKITINDGLSILKGKNDEATQFLKRNTSNDLGKEFKPIIATSLKKVQITKYWNPLFTSYNKMPFVKRVNPNLDEYVTQRAIEGLFKLVALEEAKIRQDPAARVNDILKKVFGGK
jgi:hypothetical protein